MEDAEDLVQEAYLRALQSFQRFELGTNFKGWIFKILFNAFVNAYRKRAIQNEAPASHNLEFLHERMANNPGLHRDNPERIAMIRQATVALQAALDKIPNRFRTVVHLADIEGHTYREIATILGCPIGTVMSRLHRARRSLRATSLTPVAGPEATDVGCKRGPLERSHEAFDRRTGGPECI